MPTTIKNIPLGLLWVLMASLCLFLVYTTLLYFSFRPDINFLQVKQDVVYNVAWRTSFYIHITGGILALGTVPFQLIPAIRRKNIQLHRTLGKIYVAGILFIGAPAGFYMAFFANGGKVATVGFIILSFLWFYTTYMGLWHVRKGNITAHRRWMLRSFALTFAAVTLRLWVPVLSYGFHVDYDVTIVLTAWLSWVPNILVIEGILYSRKIKIKPQILTVNNQSL